MGSIVQQQSNCSDKSLPDSLDKKLSCHCYVSKAFGFPNDPPQTGSNSGLPQSAFDFIKQLNLPHNPGALPVMLSAFASFMELSLGTCPASGQSDQTSRDIWLVCQLSPESHSGLIVSRPLGRKSSSKHMKHSSLYLYPRKLPTCLFYLDILLL